MLNHLPAHNVHVLTGKQFFPQLISGPFHHGLVIVFTMAAVVLVIAAILALRHSGTEVIKERAAVEDAAGPDRAREQAELAAAQEEIIEADTVHSAD